MKSISNFDITRLRTEEDFGFQKRIEAEIPLLTQETDKPMVESFLSALAVFDEALQVNIRNSYSAYTIQADELADAGWSGLNAQVKAVLNHPNEERRTIAAEAYELIQKYGNITVMGYNQEYGSMHNLLQDFTVLGVEKQKRIFIDEWVEELGKRYDEFVKARAARTAEEALRVTGIVKQARIGADKAFDLLVERVNALALIYGDMHYAIFIDRVNVIINETKATLAARERLAEKQRNTET